MMALLKVLKFAIFVQVAAASSIGGLTDCTMNTYAMNNSCRQYATCFCIQILKKKAGSSLNNKCMFQMFASRPTTDNSHTKPTSFYQTKKQARHILAPMVAQSDLPFRLMCEQLYNVDLSYTQMIHAYNFVESNGETFRRNHLDVYDKSIIRDVILGNVDSKTLIFTQSQRNALEGLEEDDIEASRQRVINALQRKDDSLEKTLEIKPCVVQIAAHDPNVAANGAGMILE